MKGATKHDTREAQSRTDIVIAYHTRTKHRLDRYAAGPETLDWTEQPNPWREFESAPRIPLPLNAEHISTPFAALHDASGLKPRRLSLDSVATLLELSMAISAWKEHGPDRWAVRCAPSSGNLHPTEAYVISDRVEGLDDGIYHYVSRDHSLEQRSRLDWSVQPRPNGALWIGLSSIHWREAWKYGERAFRYCQLDIGHAIGALRYAATVLGWTLQEVEQCDGGTLGRLLGLDRDSDFGNAEREQPEVLLAVIPNPVADDAQRAFCATEVPAPAVVSWQGRANILDPHPMYHWPAIDTVAAATLGSGGADQAEFEHWPYPPLPGQGASAAVDILRGRRSAQQFDRKFTLGSAPFFHLLDSILPRASLPWDVWRRAARVHPLIFVHRVEGLAPGLYLMTRRTHADRSFRSLLPREFLWRRVETAPERVVLHQLMLGDLRQTARIINCHQAIASDACFTLAMLAEFAKPVSEDPWRYRQLHWEAGLLGHTLYVEAEALGLRGTGVGCFFDEALHDALGFPDDRYQSLYHFTVGRPITDGRIVTTPPYAGRATLQSRNANDAS
jgi:SagB-type dehydrogenase family enzyme